MSVALTVGGFEPKGLDINKRLALLKTLGLDIPFEWSFQASGAGDASAGYVSCGSMIDFGALNPDVYYVITDIKTNSTSSLDVKLWTHSDRWVKYYHQLLADKEITLWSADGLYNSYGNRDRLKKPIYLGKPRNADADNGLCHFNWETNNDGETYTLLMLGFALKQPLPLACLSELSL